MLRRPSRRTSTTSRNLSRISIWLTSEAPCQDLLKSKAYSAQSTTLLMERILAVCCLLKEPKVTSLIVSLKALRIPLKSRAW